ncbi:MAG: adenylate/guanylate cyclase domain-containing protein [Elusimicrobiaceae bacterium]|nr:adenylate/guanylate cyclase domain-containing protein [Elusimicrobiaceae bacterium]
MASKIKKLPLKIPAALGAFSVFMAVLFWLNIFAFKTRFMPAPVQWLDNIAYDVTVSAIGGVDGDPRISVAAIDDYSINQYGWPFPRKYYAELIYKLNALGAKVIVFDVMFLNPDVRSPEADRAIAEASRKAGNVVHSGLITLTRTGAGNIYSFQHPTGEIWKTASIVATPNVDDVIDSDGKVRRVILYDTRAFYSRGAGSSCMKDCESENVVSLSLAAYAAYNKIPLPQAVKAAGADPVRWLMLTGPRMFPSNPARKNRENDENVYALYPHISFADIISGELSDGQKAAIKGGIVLVGSTALGNYDHYPSAFMERTPGVEFHANSVDNLLRSSYMKEITPWAVFLTMLAFIWLPLAFFKRSIYISGGVAAALLAGWTVLYGALILSGYMLSFIMPPAGLLCSFIFLTAYRVVFEGQEKRWIKQTFGQYLSPAVVDVLVKNPEKLKLGGEKRDMSVLFLDIAKFTSISEKLTPEELTEFLNKYLTALTDIILKNDGVVDKYIGDCIMAFWNAPLDDPQHRVKACRAACECIEAIRTLNQDPLIAAMPIKPQVRIGLNSGDMVVGNMGSGKRFSYTVIGDNVNLASRLEGANKYFGSSIMASEECYGGASESVAARELGRVRVVGKDVPIKVYELFGPREAIPEETNRFLAAYAAGVELYGKRDFAGAADKFSSALELAPQDKVCKFYLAQCAQYRAAPPQPDWDGVFNLTSK